MTATDKTIYIKLIVSRTQQCHNYEMICKERRSCGTLSVSYQLTFFFCNCIYVFDFVIWFWIARISNYTIKIKPKNFFSYSNNIYILLIHLKSNLIKMFIMNWIQHCGQFECNTFWDLPASTVVLLFKKNTCISIHYPWLFDDAVP